VIERVVVSWKDASFAVFAALAWLSVSFLSCPQMSVDFGSRAVVEITAALPSPGPTMVLIEDDDREFREGDLELCGLPGVCLVSPPSLPLSQITPRQSFSLSALTPAQRPLRC